MTKSIHNIKESDSNLALTKSKYFVNNSFTKKIFTIKSGEFSSD